MKTEGALKQEPLQVRFSYLLRSVTELLRKVERCIQAELADRPMFLCLTLRIKLRISLKEVSTSVWPINCPEPTIHTFRVPSLQVIADEFAQ